MIFIDNKYTQWYYTIINSAKARTLPAGVCKDVHHIVPKSFFKEYSKTGWIDGNPHDLENLVALTIREHFICHLLLTRMTQGLARKKAIYAAYRNTTGLKKKNNRRVSSRTYQTVREQWESINVFKDKSWQLENANRNRGKKLSQQHIESLKRSWTPERKKKQSEQNKGISRNKTTNKGKKIPKLTGPNNGFYGKTHSKEWLEERRKLLKGITPAFVGVKKKCPYCLKEFDSGNYARYHGNKCRYKTSDHEPAA